MTNETTELIDRLRSMNANLHESLCGTCSVQTALRELASHIERAGQLPDSELETVADGIALDLIAVQCLMDFARVLEKNKMVCGCRPAATTIH